MWEMCICGKNIYKKAIKKKYKIYKTSENISVVLLCDVLIYYWCDFDDSWMMDKGHRENIVVVRPIVVIMPVLYVKNDSNCRVKGWYMRSTVL